MSPSKPRPQTGLAPAIVLVLSSCTAMWAIEFTGGTGELGDPYLIATAEQFVGMGQDPTLRDKHFALVADIDLDPFLPGRTVFEGAVVFWILPASRRGGTLGGLAGSFDGRGHAIRNCIILRTGATPHTGLFGLITPQGRVCNLRVEDAWIVDSWPSGSSVYASYGGILAGENAGTIDNCSASGTIVAGPTESDLPAKRGGLIGHNSGTISRCYTEAYVSGSEAGGIAGVNAGAIHHCSGSAYIFGNTAGGLVGLNDQTGSVILCSADGYTAGGTSSGGLVGDNAGTLQFCFAEGYAFGSGAGGLVGNNSGTVRESYASAWVSSTYGGGLVGHNTSEVVNCCATSLLDPNPVNYRKGGLVADNDGTIVSSYSTATLDNEDATPVPLVGSGGGSSIRRSYYLSMDKEPIVPGRSGLPSGQPLLAEEMEDRASFVGFDFYGDSDDGDAGHWFMPESGYPVLTWQTEVTGLAGVPDIAGLDVHVASSVLERAGFVLGALDSDHDRFVPACGEQGCLASYARCSYYAPPGSLVQIVASLGPYDFSMNPGDGNQASPFQIETAGQLDSLAGPPGQWNSHFALTADIDMSHRVYSHPLVEQFSGTLDGNGHVIRAFQIDTPLTSSSHCGLFGIIEPGGVVLGLTLTAVRLRTDTFRDYGDVDIGMLAGENQGRIEGCRVSGQICAGGQSVGGLVGLNNGQIVDCAASGRIEGGSTVGGLVGTNTQSILGCKAVDVNVSGGCTIGGLAGVNGGADAGMEACYASGHVQGDWRVAGLLAVNAVLGGRGGTTVEGLGSIRNCYTSCSVSGQTEVAGCIAVSAPDSIQENCFFLDPNDGGGPDNGLGTALSDAQMKQQASFVGWDFESVWTICAGVDYPRLRWEDVECE